MAFPLSCSLQQENQIIGLLALRLCSAQIVQNPIVLETFEMKCKWIKKTNVLNWSNMSIVCYYLIKWNGYDCSSKQPNVCKTSAARLAPQKNPTTKQ